MAAIDRYAVHHPVSNSALPESRDVSDASSKEHQNRFLDAGTQTSPIRELQGVLCDTTTQKSHNYGGISACKPHAIFKIEGKECAHEIQDIHAFLSLLKQAKEQNKYGDCVYLCHPHYYQNTNSRLFVTPSGKAGLAVTQSGELMSVFSVPGKEENAIDNLMAIAKQAGACKARCFDTGLVEFFQKYGYQPVAQIPLPTPLSDKPQYKKFNDGKPNNVFLVLDEHKALGTLSKEAIPYVQLHDQGMLKQEEALGKIHAFSNAGSPQTPLASSSRHPLSLYRPSTGAIPPPPGGGSFIPPQRLPPPPPPPWLSPPPPPPRSLPSSSLSSSSSSSSSPLRELKRTNSMAENFLREKFEELPGNNTERPRLSRVKMARNQSNTAPIRRSQSYDSFPGRIDNVLHLSGFEAGPTSKDFLNNVKQYMKACWAHDRSAAMDQISMQAYAETRRRELAKIPGAGYLAEQYGLQTADQTTPFDSRIGLRIDHEMSSTYHRDKKNPEFHDLCFSLYKKKHGAVAPDPKMVAFAHSNTAFEQLKRIMPEEITSDPQNDRAACVKQVMQGLIAIEFRDKNAARRATEELEKIGGTPSLYTVLKNSHPDSELELTPDLSLDNGAHLKALLRNEEHGPLTVLEQLPSTHPMKSVAESALSVLDGLKQLAEHHGDTPGFKHSMLIDNAVNALSKVVHALASTTEDSTRFFAGYQALLEETHLILAATKPYTEQDFKQAAAASFKTRAGDVFNKLKIADPEAHLFSSGMSAISLALDIAKELGGEAQLLSDHQGSAVPEYFEVPPLLDNSTGALGKSKKKKLSERRVFTAILNPSTPNKLHADDSTNNWDAKKLVQETKKRLALPHIHPGAPMYLVLDSTIEKPGPHGTSDMAEVLDGLKDAINDGSLIIFDCKSYQKQQSLHSGKIMAGRCTVIGKDGESTSIAKKKFRAAEQDINWMHSDDSQSLTHMVKHAQQNELSILKSTAQNAAFVHKYCLDAKDIPGFDGYEEGIPLGIIANVTKRISATFPGNEPGNKIRNHLKLWDFIEAATEFRNSFGFMRSSHLNVGGPFQVRLSIGQESREELMEKMYGLGWLIKTDRNTLQIDDVLKEITDITERASQIALSKADVRKWGNTALHILETRAKRATSEDLQGNRVIAECKSLLLNLDKTATKPTLRRKPAAIQLKHWAQQNVTSAQQAAQVLREKLTAELERTAAHSSNVVADRMNIVGSAFAPVLPHLIDDVAWMRTRMHRDPPGIANMNNGTQEQQDAYVDARYAPNMVASMLSLISTSFDNDVKGISRETIMQLDSFYNDILSTGLPGLSPSARTKMMKEWLSLNEEKLESEEPSVVQDEEKLESEEPSVVQEWADKVVSHAHLFPYSEEKAKVLEGIPEATFKAMASETKNQLIRALFAPLDVDARGAFVKKLAMLGHDSKIDSCLDFIDKELTAADDGWINILRPDRLNSPRGNAMEMNANERRKIIQDALLRPRIHLTGIVKNND